VRLLRPSRKVLGPPMQTDDHQCSFDSSTPRLLDLLDLPDLPDLPDLLDFPDLLDLLDSRLPPYLPP
jgi:hypothetical protein